MTRRGLDENIFCLHHGKQTEWDFVYWCNIGLVKRVYEHKNDLTDGFTKKYGVKMLVYYEDTNDVEAAIHRETQMKKWNRKWKLELIEKMNPDWKDLYNDIIA